MAEKNKKEPLHFEEVLSRVFPLPAEPDKLQKLIDETLNIQDTHYFKVTSPFVYMQLLSYGRMQDKSRSTYHTSQRELLFMVPVEWYELVDEDSNDDETNVGDYRFNNKSYRLSKRRKASVTPFIFVDNELSVVDGRERFGWSKGLMEISQSDNGWVDAVQPKDRLVAIDVRAVDDYDADKRPRRHQLLEICRSTGISVNLSERSFANLVNDRLDEVKHFIDTQVSMAGYFFEVGRNLVGLGYGGHSLLSSPSRIKHYLFSMREDMQRYMGNSIGMKQFLDSEDPEKVAYFAVANTHARISKVTEAGFLGSIETIVGTISGGYRIKIAKLDSHPIVEKLGLKVKTIESDGRGKDPDKYVLTPVLPFWLTANAEYYGADELIYEEVHGENVTGKIKDRDQPDYMEEYESVKPGRS